MSVSYNRLWKLLIDKKMSQSELRKEAGIAPNTMTKMRRDEAVSYTHLCRGDRDETAGWEKYDDVEKSEIQPDDAGSGQGNI